MYKTKEAQQTWESSAVGIASRRKARKKWAGNNPESRRQYRLKNSYGITPEEYEQLYTVQEGKCAICGNCSLQERLHVDHDHVSRRVRGLLCFTCNVLLGNAKDKESILLAAITYLRKPC